MPNRGRVALDRPASSLKEAAFVASALDLLDEQGLAGCTLDAVEQRLGIDPCDAAVRFRGRDELFEDMAQAMVEAADRTVRPGEPGGSWRDLLRRRALVAQAAMCARRDGGLLFAALPVLPPIPPDVPDCVTPLCDAGFSLFDARAAVQVIDRFAIGWAVAEEARPAASEDEGLPGYEDQVATLIAGIAATRAAGGAAMKHRMFQGRLWVFLRNARDSANIAFSRADRVNELDRRILLLLHAQGDLTLAAISAANGVDKAQVSRAIKRLDQIGLVARSGIRSPLRLSASGQQIAERLMRLAELRNRELTFGISDEQLVDLFGVLDTLVARAMALYEQERKLSAAAYDTELDFPDHEQLNKTYVGHIPVDRSRILPPFITLCSYMMRAGSLGYKRATGLSNFDTWVLVEVCRDPPISWPQLVIALYRDQSQAGRTVRRLMELGLIERGGKPGRRHGFFSPTAEGKRIAAIINGMAAKRSEFLFQGIPSPQLTNFMAAFDVLARNAEVQLAREKAMQEMDRE